MKARESWPRAWRQPAQGSNQGGRLGSCNGMQHVRTNRGAQVPVHSTYGKGPRSHGRPMQRPEATQHDRVRPKALLHRAGRSHTVQNGTKWNNLASGLYSIPASDASPASLCPRGQQFSDTGTRRWYAVVVMSACGDSGTWVRHLPPLLHAVGRTQ